MAKRSLLTLIVGPRHQPRGVGKSTLAGHFASNRMIPPQSFYDIAKCDVEIAKLQAGGWQVSRPADLQHTVYATEKIKTTGMGYDEQISIDLCFDDIGLQIDGGRKVMHVLPCSTIVVFEIQRKLDSRKSMTDGPDAELLSFLELQRQFEISMIADGQLYGSIDKRFREFADFVIEVQKQDHEYGDNDPDKKCPIKTTWECFEFAGSGDYEKYLAGDTSVAIKATYTHYGNIYEVVDSFVNRGRFTYGLQNGGNFEINISAPPGYEKDSQVKYCQQNPLAKPKKTKGEENDKKRN